MFSKPKRKQILIVLIHCLIFFTAFLSADTEVLELNDENIRKFGYSEWSKTLKHDEISNNPHVLDSACNTGSTSSSDPILGKACNHAKNQITSFQTANSPDDFGLSLGWGPKNLSNPSHIEIKHIASTIIRDSKKIISEIGVETFLPDIFKINIPRGGKHRCYNRYIDPDGWPFRAKCIEAIRRRLCRWCPRVHCGDRYFMPVYYRQVSLIIETPKTLLHSRRFPAWVLNFHNTEIPGISKEMREQYIKFNNQISVLAAWLRGEVLTNSDYLRLQGLKAIKHDDAHSLADIKDLLDAEAGIEKQVLLNKLGSGVSFSNSSNTSSQNPLLRDITQTFDKYASILRADPRFAGSAMSNPLLTRALGKGSAAMVGHFPISNPIATQVMRAVDIESNGGNDRTNIHPMIEFDWCHMFGSLFFPGLGALEGVTGAAEFVNGVYTMIQILGNQYINFAREVANLLSTPNISADSLFNLLSGESWTKREWLHEKPNIGARVGLPIQQLADMQKAIQQAFPTHRMGSRALNFRFERVSRRFCNEVTGEPPLPPARWLDKKYSGHPGFNPNLPKDGDLNVAHFFDTSRPLESLRRLTVLAYSPDFPDIIGELLPDANPLRIIQPGGESRYPLGSFLTAESPFLVKFLADAGIPEHTKKLAEFLTSWNSPFRSVAFDECSPFEAKLIAGTSSTSLTSVLNPFSVLQPLLKGEEVVPGGAGEKRYRQITETALGRRCVVGKSLAESGNYAFEFEAQVHSVIRGLNSMLRHGMYLMSKNQIEARVKDDQSLGFLSHDSILNFHPDRPVLNRPGSERCRAPAKLISAEASSVARAGDSNPLLDGSQVGQEFWLWTERTCCLRGSPKNGYLPYGS